MKVTGRKKIILVEGDDTLVSFGGGIILDAFIHRLGILCPFFTFLSCPHALQS
ncbi:MAG: hypothetical protein ACXWMH_07740 [Syntrophales bacterium]